MIPYDLEQTQEIARTVFAPPDDPLELTQEIPTLGAGVFRKVEQIHDETVFCEVTK